MQVIMISKTTQSYKAYRTKVYSVDACKVY